MRRSLIILPVLTLAARLSGTRVINVADHGIAPGKDVTFEVNQLIASPKGQRDVTICFPRR